MAAARVPGDWRFEEAFDTLDMACGDALLELRLRITPLAPGTRLLVSSHDAGSPAEIPAWCRLTGHILLEEAPPYFLIERRRESED